MTYSDDYYHCGIDDCGNDLGDGDDDGHDLRDSDMVTMTMVMAIMVAEWLWL